MTVTLPRKFFNDDEELLVELRPHWVFFAGPLLIAVVVLAGFIALLIALSPLPNWATDVLLIVVLLPVLWLLGRLLRWRNYTLALTTIRIVVRRGVLSRNTTQIRLQRITEISLSQKLWERVLSTGRLLIDVQGQDDAVVLEFVRKPALVQRFINGQINELTGCGAAEPIPPELLQVSLRRPENEPEPPSPTHYDTPPFGVPVVIPEGNVGAAPPPRHAAGPTTQPVPTVGAPPQPTAATGSAMRAGPGEIRDRLIELDDLRQRKIISEDEFAAKKAELLSRI
jgi:membrane protein YdbS with pleckstrin-like domain